MMRLGPVLLAIAAIGCATTKQLLDRASYDLNCPASELVIAKIDARTRGVRGCGMQVTYLESCSPPAGLARECTWVLNTDARALPAHAGGDKAKGAGASHHTDTDLDLRGDGWRVQMRAKRRTSGAPLAMAVLIGSGKNHDCELRLLADGEALHLTGQAVIRRGDRLVYRAKLPHDQMARLARAETVTVGTCKQRIDLYGGTLSDLQDFAAARVRLASPQVQAAPVQAVDKPVEAAGSSDAPVLAGVVAGKEGSADAGDEAEDVESRLARLHELFERGIITQEEHDQRRAAIIESL